MEAGLNSRFHFDLENGREAIRDEEGVWAINLAAALEQVTAGVDELRAAGEFEDIADGWFLVVRDDAGVVRKCLPL
ncbi:MULTISPECIES: DUF6894 family protein [Methylorubrum]|uniref:DUF6894 family protein n=1 Tax=Methylorubrum TaxID=2282523 RepID=UPI001FED61F3|nr:hypothetical protein [Methylorubrum populi]